MVGIKTNVRKLYFPVYGKFRWNNADIIGPIQIIALCGKDDRRVILGSGIHDYLLEYKQYIYKMFLQQDETLTIDERNTCYDADTSPHAHFLCKRCGKIYDLPHGETKKKVETWEMNGHDVQEIHFYYKGICKDCKQKDSLKQKENREINKN